MSQAIPVETLVARLLAIWKAMGDWTDAAGPTRVPTFCQLVSVASAQGETMAMALTDARLGDDARSIGIMAMQRVSLGVYVEFCDRVMDLVQEGLVDKKFVADLACPMPQWSQVLVRNWQDASVVRVMGRAGRLDPRLKEYCAAVSSGEGWRWVEEARASGADEHWECRER